MLPAEGKIEVQISGVRIENPESLFNPSNGLFSADESTAVQITTTEDAKPRLVGKLIQEDAERNGRIPGDLLRVDFSGGID